MTPIEQICDEIKASRIHGQQKYGGSDPVGHDLGHSLGEWLGFVRDHLERANLSGAGSMDQREHLIKAAGLLLSAIWAEDVNAGRIPLNDCNAIGRNVVVDDLVSACKSWVDYIDGVCQMNVDNGLESTALHIKEFHGPRLEKSREAIAAARGNL